MRYVNAADAKYAPTPERPSRLHNAWAEMKPGWCLRLPYGDSDADAERYRIPEGIGPLVIDKRYVSIVGDGPNGYGIIAANADSDALEVRVSTLQIERLAISRYFWREVPEGAPANKGKGCGIVYRNETELGGLTLERVSIEYMGDAGLAFRGIGDRGYQVSPVLRDLNVYGCGGHGIEGFRVTAAEANVNVTACGKAGLALDQSAGGRWHVTSHSQKGPQQVYWRECDGIEMHAWIEDFPDRDGLVLDHSESCRVSGFFGADRSTASIRLRPRCVGNTLRASRHFGYANTPLVTDGNDSTVRDNIIEKQTGAEVRVNSRRNRIL